MDFWLPKIFPKRVKVIVTIAPDSEYKDYFKFCDCDTISLGENHSVKTKILRELTETNKYDKANQDHVK